MPSYTYKISELPSAASLNNSSILPIVDGTITKKVTAQQVLNFITSSTFSNLNVLNLTGSSITGSLARFTILTGSTIVGTTAQFTILTGSTTTGSLALFTTVSGTTITGSTALFVSTTSSQAMITGDLRVLGTASITQLNTLNQTSLFIGDKYITILSGGVDHTGINGAGILWGTSSGPGETTGSLGEHAHILYNAASDGLQLFPALTVSGANNTILFNVSGATSYFSGNVGIGTSSPQVRLHVSGGSGEITRFGTTIARGLGQNYISFYDPTGRKGFFGYGSGASDDFFITNEMAGAKIHLATTVSQLIGLTVDSSQNVGIGTSSPRASLQVTRGGSTAIPVSGGSVVSSSLYLTNPDDLYGMMFGVSGSGTGWIQQQRRDSNVQYPLLLNPVGGNVGIGTTSPQVNSKLHVAGGSSDVLLRIDTTGADPLLTWTTIGQIDWSAGIDFSDGGKFKIQNSLTADTNTKLTIDNAGNVGIGTTSPSTRLHVAGGSGLTLETVNTAWADIGADVAASNYLKLRRPGTTNALGYIGGGGGGAISAGSSNDLAIRSEEQLHLATGNSPRVTITSAGNVGIGTSSPSFQLELSSDSAAKPSTNTWTISSDIRIKENVQNYVKGLETLIQINPVTYDYNGKAGFNSAIKNNIGLIAQDVKDILPESISTYKTKLNLEDTEDTELYNFNSHALTYIMINSIKQLLEEVNTLKTEIQTLKSGSI